MAIHILNLNLKALPTYQIFLKLNLYVAANNMRLISTNGGLICSNFGCGGKSNLFIAKKKFSLVHFENLI
jgi:hypothetical protein